MQATAEYRLLGFLNRAVPSRGRRGSLQRAVRMDNLCGRPTVQSPGTVYPLHAVGSAAPPQASLAVGASWLFMHLPTSMSAGALRRCQSPDANADASGAPLQPFIMAHLCGIRTGAWSRRALVRAYGWWHSAADRLVAAQLGWGRRRPLLVVHEPRAGRLPALTSSVRSQAMLDVLAGNLLLLGLLLGRRVVIPEVTCGLLSSGAMARRGFGSRPVSARHLPGGAPLCGWVPPRECWAVEYVTALEYEHEMAHGVAAGVDAGATRTAEAPQAGRGRQLATNATEALRQRAERLRARVAAGDFEPSLLRDLASAMDQLAADTGGAGGAAAMDRPMADAAGGGAEARLLPQRSRLSSKGANKGARGARGRPKGGALAGCDETGRKLVHVLTPPDGRNASGVLIRRRLREMACERAHVLSVLPEQSSALWRAGDVASQSEPIRATQSQSELSQLSPSKPERQEWQLAQMLRLLATVPLTRQGVSLRRFLSRAEGPAPGNASEIDRQREATDVKCIEHLLSAV